MNRSFLLCFFLLIIGFSCTFESDEEFYHEITPPSPDELAIYLDSYSPTDTIYVYGATKLSLSFNAGRGSVTDAQAFLGTAPLSISSTSTEGYYFNINYSNLRTGTFPLRVEFTARSGTGSLADKSGHEYVSASQQWIVKIDVDRPKTPTLTFSEENGMLKLSWPKHTKPDFSSYYLTRTYNGGERQNIHITDANQNFWIDEGYTGCTPKRFEYHLSVYSKNGSAEVERSKIDPFTVTFENFQESDSTVLVKWNKCQYPGAFKEYLLYGETITQIDDTVRLVKLKDILFGTPHRISFRTDAKNNNLSAYGREYSSSFSTGIPCPTGDYIHFNDYLNTFFVNQNEKLGFLNDKFEPAGEKVLGTSFHSNPYPGRYIYSLKGNRFYSEDLVTETIKSVPLGYYTAVKGTNAGIVNLTWDEYKNGRTTYYSQVVQMDGNVLLFSRSSTTSFLTRVSNDGQYIWTSGNKIYKRSDNTYSEFNTLAPTGSFNSFRLDKCEEVMFSDLSNMRFYDINTGLLLRTYNHYNNTMTCMGYDAYTKHLLWAADNSRHVVVQHIDTGVSKTIPMAYGQRNSVRLVNGYLIANNRAIKVIE